MTTQSDAVPAQELLTETRDLTARIRRAQQGGWFPLLVFAAVTFLAIPFNRYGHHRIHCETIHAAHTPTSSCIAYSSLGLWYWPVALLAAYLVISWFYIRRSHRRGVGTRIAPFVTAGAALALLATIWALWATHHPALLTDTLGVPSSQPTQWLHRIISPAGAIGLGLLLLARIERSPAVLIAAIGYILVTITATGSGWFHRPSPWAPLPHLFIAGTVLLLGAALTAATQRPTRA